MKHFAFVILFAVLLALRAFGGALPVVDAAALAGQQRDYIEQLLQAAQGEEELRRLAQQILQIDESLKRLGDPAVVSRLAGSEVLSEYLKRAELNKPTGDLRLEASVPGLLQSDPLLKSEGVGDKIEFSGQVVAPRDNQLYLPEALAQQGLNQYEAVRSEVLAQRAVLKREIAANVEQAKAATTTAEVMKLSAVASTLHAELAATDRELEFASLEVAHLGQAKKLRAEVQKKAQVENERAALSRSAKRDAETFRISTQPILFNR